MSPLTFLTIVYLAIGSWLVICCLRDIGSELIDDCPPWMPHIVNAIFILIAMMLLALFWLPAVVTMPYWKDKV